MVKDFVVENTASEADDARDKGIGKHYERLSRVILRPKISDNALVVSSDASDLGSVTDF